MLIQLFHNQISLGIAQAVAATLLVLVVVLVARWQDIHIEQETSVALLRSLVQIVAVGSILMLLLRGPEWTGIVVLVAMVLSAALLSSQRSRSLPGAFLVALCGIGGGAGIIIALMMVLGVIDTAINASVPVGSMLIFSSMTTHNQAVERFLSDIKAHAARIEAELALGARARTVVVPYAQAAVRASMMPRIDSLRSLGIVWIPGLMAGMVLSGEDPVYAAVYQFVTMAMVFSVSGVTSVVSTHLVSRRVFSSADQLRLRQG